MKKSLEQTLLEDFLFRLTNLWEDEAIQSEVSLPNLSKMVQKTLPGVPNPAEFTTTVNNLKPFQKYVKQASRTQFPSALGGQIIPRVVNLEGGLEKYIFNRVRDKETVLASIVWDPSSKRIVGQHLEKSKLTPEELEYVKTWINNNLYGSPFNPNSVIPTNIHENQHHQQHRSAELTAQELDPLNYHGGDSNITTLLHKATKEVGPKRNHLELLMSFLARKEEEHQGYIEKLLADNEEQRAEIEALIKDIGSKEKRFQDFNQEVSRLKTMPVQKQAQQAQQMAQTPPVQESLDNYLLKKLANNLTNLWEDEILTEKWSQKYKSSINCSHPKGFSQKAHCAGKKKHNESHEVMEMTCPDCGMCETHGSLNEIKKGAKDSNGFTKCWPGHHAAGTKKGKNGGRVRNCVPNESIEEDWNKVNHHDHTNGLSQKAVNAYRREHPGSKLKTAVTTKPSKLKAGSKAAKRRKSFCARMSGNKGPMKKPNGKPTPKALALRRWHCESLEELYVTANQRIYEAEGEPSGLKHLTPHLAQDILDQMKKEGIHAIVKSIEWGDGGAKELIAMIKRDLEQIANNVSERMQPASSFAGSNKNKINGKGMLPANAKFAKAGDLVGGG